MLKSDILDEHGWSGLTGCPCERGGGGGGGGGPWMLAACCLAGCPGFFSPCNVFPAAVRLVLPLIDQLDRSICRRDVYWDTAPLFALPCLCLSRVLYKISHVGMDTCWACLLVFMRVFDEFFRYKADVARVVSIFDLFSCCNSTCDRSVSSNSTLVFTVNYFPGVNLCSRSYWRSMLACFF